MLKCYIQNMKLFTKSAVQVVGIIMIILIIPLLLSMKSWQTGPQEPWVVPQEFKNMKNPVMVNDSSIKAGKVLYDKHCASCHGKTGLGDGIIAGNLETFPGDFSGSEYQGQTDGDHFYKTKYGREDMPKYENKISDADIWRIVNYMRSFKK
jgi:mono/diheme cytochrome c family protein